MVKICKSCNRTYPLEESMCDDCTVELSWEMLPGDKKPDANSTDEASGTNKPQPAKDECPVCGTDLTSLTACPRCKKSDAGYRLCWQDADIGKTLIASGQPVFIGRVPPVDKELARHIEERFPFVSRIHAEIYLERDGNLYLRDMNSINGTYVNNQRVAAYLPQRLKKGDVVSFSKKLCAEVEQC